MIINLLLLAAASPAAPAPTQGRTDLERIVVRGTVEDQATLKKWLADHHNEPKRIEAELIASGFKREPASGNCFGYFYSGREAGTRDDRAASVTYCNGKLGWVSITTWLPVEKNPKGPLPLIKPATQPGN